MHLTSLRLFSARPGYSDRGRRLHDRLLAEAGDEVKRGAELAARDINAAGGVNGRKIVLSIEDDAYDPKQAVSAANHVVGEQITLVDGHVCSGASIPASEVYAEYDVLMMTPASVNSKPTDDAFAKGWPTIMRLYARDDNQGKMVGAWMADRYRNKKIAFVHDKSTYGKNLADQVKANLNAAGVQEILYEGINPGEKDYSAIVGKLKRLGPKSSITAAIRPRAASFCVRLPTRASNSKW